MELIIHGRVVLTRSLNIVILLYISTLSVH